MSFWRCSLLLVGSLLAGCGLPKDPEHTTDRVRSNGVRIGVSERSPWVTRSGAEPSGVEADWARAFAARHGLEIKWRWGSEQELLDALMHFELELVLAGLVEDSPWAKSVGVTKPYCRVTHETGNSGTAREIVEAHVLAVPPGENAWLAQVQSGLWDSPPARAPGVTCQ